MTPAAAPLAEHRTVQQRMVRIALREARRGVREIPARSNTGPAIRRYHVVMKLQCGATSGVGRVCGNRLCGRAAQDRR